MGFADLDQGKSSSAGISDLEGDNHLFLLAVDVINLGPQFCGNFKLKKYRAKRHNLQRTGKPHRDFRGKLKKNAKWPL
jgi:hypothetical protein